MGLLHIAVFFLLYVIFVYPSFLWRRSLTRASASLYKNAYYRPTSKLIQVILQNYLSLFFLFCFWKTLAREITSCFWRADIKCLDFFYFVGSTYVTRSYALMIVLQSYLCPGTCWTELLSGFDISGFFCPCFLSYEQLSFVSYANIREQQSYSSAYVKNESLDVLEKQNRKRKTNSFVKWLVLIVEVDP